MTIPLRELTLHGHTVSYRMAGRGPVLALLHGIAGSSATWEELIPPLAEQFTVIAPDANKRFKGKRISGSRANSEQ